MINLRSTSFSPDQKIPEKHSGDGGDLSPPLTWNGGPPDTKEYALICDDPDAPMEEPFVHWVLYNLPASQNSIPEGSNGGGTEGKNTAGKNKYMGPKPPPGHGVHHYHFKLYALDTKLDLGPGATKNELLKAIEGHVLEEGELIGTYER